MGEITKIYENVFSSRFRKGFSPDQPSEALTDRDLPHRLVIAHVGHNLNAIPEKI
jgi:hypothetical protein